ncbi:MULTISPECIES: hypothetical protein [Limnobaculum]|uniref:hypothetical protein n=1 Tax=Limnobaculum TaxID=2172100 RepID=UPI00112A0FA5|nr:MULTISPECIES: hypothetical protein [Limnobaculum]TQS89324.1 hypothetical protein ELQ32_06080 [Limnobaculum zhutongyuii]
MQVYLSNEALISAVIRMKLVMESLSENGVTIKNVMLNGGSPVIRVARCSYCDQMVRDGRAQFVSFGCGPCGHFKQGIFILDGCKVVWSESLH